jgi:hypothetical protein
MSRQRPTSMTAAVLNIEIRVLPNSQYAYSLFEDTGGSAPAPMFSLLHPTKLMCKPTLSCSGAALGTAG